MQLLPHCSVLINQGLLPWKTIYVLMCFAVSLVLDTRLYSISFGCTFSALFDLEFLTSACAADLQSRYGNVTSFFDFISSMQKSDGYLVMMQASGSTKDLIMGMGVHIGH